MSMEISNGYENHYLNKIQMNQQEKAEETAKNNMPENIPTPKDEYISSEQLEEKPSGLYHMGQDEKGNPKVIYDDSKKLRKGKM